MNKALGTYMTANKKTLTATITILLIATAAFATMIPLVHAVKTYCFLSVNPNPVGVNQPVVVSAWINPIPAGFGSTTFSGLVITITNEAGEQVFRWEDDRSDALGATYFNFVPNATGNYTCDFTYGGDRIGGTTYDPSHVDEPTILVVQETPIPEYPSTPVTGDYWTRPIPSTNRDWASISGNWLMEGYEPGTYLFDAARGFNPYSQAPRAPHIMWTKELTTGGLVGGELGVNGYYPGLSYQPKLKPPLILNGRLFYNVEPSGFGSPQGPGFVCVDLRTGEEIYRVDDATINMGQTYYYATPNQMGVLGAWLWSTTDTTWELYDSFDGELLGTFTGVPSAAVQSASTASTSGVVRHNEKGEMLVYYLSGSTLYRWNSTVAFEEAGWIGGGFGGIGSSSVTPGTFSWQDGIDMSTNVGSGYSGAIAVGFAGDVLVYASIGSTVTVYGFSTVTGEHLYTTPAYTLSATSQYNYAMGDGVFAVNDPAKMTWVGWNATTGEQIWESDPMVYPWGAYQAIPGMAYNTLYTVDYAGAVTAINLTDGSTIWQSFSDEGGLDSPYGRYPFYYGPIVADGVVFAANGEHSPTQPLIQGEALYAFNAYTGERLWKMEGWFVLGAIADGYLIAYNAIDNRIYCIGKGPSTTEVSIPTNPVNAGETVAILGKVTDQSTALKDTPAIADVNMAEWMEYKVMQHSMPADAVGVPVQTIITYPNGTQVVLDYTIGDMGGSFAAKWTPPEEGIYQVTAYFKGTDSYGSSYATIHIIVDPADPGYPQYGSTAWPAYPETMAYTTADLLLMVAVVIAILLCAIIVLMLRKKK